MKRTLAALLALAALVAPAAAQSPPNPAFYFGFVPTSDQWNSLFRAKADYLGFTPLNPSSVVGTLPIVVTPSGGVVTVSAPTAARTDIVNMWTGCCQGNFLVTTPNPFTSTNEVINSAFVQNAIRASMATVPLSGVTGGTYSFASLGTQGTGTVTASGGAVTGISSMASGTGWKVGDLFTVGPGGSGNYDAVLRVLTLSGSTPATAEVLYGGTGYANASPVNFLAPSTLSSYTLTVAGAKTSNVTFVMPKGTYLFQSDQWIINNNTTGAHNLAVKISDGTDTATGTGVIVPQGMNDSTATTLQTNGVTDVRLAESGSAQAGVTVYNVLNGGAKCDGVTDDTTALKALGATISAAGGNAQIVFPAGANCLTFNSGQAFSSGLGTLFDFSGGVGNIIVQGNGATITNNHTFTGSDALYNFYCVCTNIRIDNLKIVQTNAVTLPAATPIGTVGIWNFGGGNTIVTNMSVTGGQAAVFLSNTTKAVLENITSTSSVYGIATFNGPVNDLFVRNLVVDGTGHDRAVFVKGLANADISVTSLNALANDILISTDSIGGIVENVKINYRIQARTTGVAGSYVAFGAGDGCAAACANSIWKNININIAADLSGDTAIAPLVQFRKGSVSAMGLVFENIRISGIATGVPNFAGNIFDLFRTADAPWNGEVASNISLENMLIAGSTTPNFFIDFAPFPSATYGGFVTRNFLYPGSYTEANAGLKSTIWFAENTIFANLTPSINTSFGGTGLFQPTAHGIPIAAGSAAFALAAPVANGVLASTATNADPAFTTTPRIVGLGIGGVAPATGIEAYNSAPSMTGNGQYGAGASATLGAILLGQGSTNDLTLQNKSGATVCAAATGGTTLNCAGLQVSGMGIAQLFTIAQLVDFNSANTDTSFTINLPVGFTHYRVISANIYLASTSLSGSTFGLFTAAAGGGSAIVAGGTASTVTATTDATANNLQVAAPGSIMTVTAATLFFRVGTAVGSAATAKVAINFIPMP